MAQVKITVNHNRCVGSQLCMNFLPAVFEMNKNGQSVVTDANSADVTSIVQTAEQCPQCAIKVEDISSGEILFPPPGLGF